MSLCLFCTCGVTSSLSYNPSLLSTNTRNNTLTNHAALKMKNERLPYFQTTRYGFGKRGSKSVGGSGELVENESESDEEIEEEENEVVLERLDVLGLGQAMVDFSGMVDDEFLERLGIQKGTRKLVNHEERGRILRAMDGCSYKAAAGGSLSNTLVALARLGDQPVGGPALSVAIAGSVGSDPLGGFYRAKLRRANVNFLSAAVTDATTGTVIVLTTPDAHRTMLAYSVRFLLFAVLL
ncbi:hypothetical protein IFM89_001487 [Coptis chinensis]|uniref:Carbohydrate kinase PfkB domain-containing protein n=1 Tax=Coptis chinensis TaxID=261450 RepID=A0A835GWE8_9MAGN|nr:hypothetical protein IFM89_001487 [Coptis chinensis]